MCCKNFLCHCHSHNYYSSLSIVQASDLKSMYRLCQYQYALPVRSKLYSDLMYQTHTFDQALIHFTQANRRLPAKFL